MARVTSLYQQKITEKVTDEYFDKMSQIDSSYASPKSHKCFVPLVEYPDRVEYLDIISARASTASSMLSYKPKSRTSSTSLEVNISSLTLNDTPTIKMNLTPSSVYMSSEKRSARSVPPSNSSRILDWLTIFFWKCSTGCQEIPRK